MTNITYTLEFYSYWHCGSGLSAGADTDALVVKDHDGLPFVPGKTIKGLVLEAAELICSLQNCLDDQLSFLGKAGAVRSATFFSDAVIDNEEHQKIVSSGLASLMYDRIASTSIDRETGVAETGTLRSMEVVVPCLLTGTVLSIPDDKVPLVKQSLAYITGIGLRRNRGLGRCHFSVIKEELL